MAETTVDYKQVRCSNCGYEFTLQRNVICCSKCGKIFTEYLPKMDKKKIEERTTTRRTGEGVDQVDG